MCTTIRPTDGPTALTAIYILFFLSPSFFSLIKNKYRVSVNAVNGVKNRHRVPRHGSMSTICYFVFRTRSCAHIASETYTPSMTSKIPTPPAEATKPIGRNRVVRNTSVKLAVETMKVTKPPYLR